MKNKKNLLEQLKPLTHFSKDSLCQLGKQLGIADTTVDTYISRFLKYKEILSLKNGLYVSSDFFRSHRNDISYFYYLANIIRTPSYVSSWSALQFYNLATETIHSITSVTPKITRNYDTKTGNYTYQTIKESLFSDFFLMSKDPAFPASTTLLAKKSSFEFDFFIASPSKALFDLLYFKTRQFRGIKSKDIKILIEELRIDIDEMDKKEQAKFYAITQKHIHNE